jgi:hypothetical protein
MQSRPADKMCTQEVRTEGGDAILARCSHSCICREKSDGKEGTGVHLASFLDDPGVLV